MPAPLDSMEIEADAPEQVVVTHTTYQNVVTRTADEYVDTAATKQAVGIDSADHSVGISPGVDDHGAYT